MINEIKIILLQYLQKTNSIVQKYSPDKLTSDAYRAEMIAATDEAAALISELYNVV